MIYVFNLFDLKIPFLNTQIFKWSLVQFISLCYEASCCVDTGFNKLIFGRGTRLTIETSE